MNLGDAVKAVKRMGMTATEKQIEAARNKETDAEERWKNLSRLIREDRTHDIPD